MAPLTLTWGAQLKEKDSCKVYYVNIETKGRNPHIVCWLKRGEGNSLDPPGSATASDLNFLKRIRKTDSTKRLRELKLDLKFLSRLIKFFFRNCAHGPSYAPGNVTTY